MVKIGEPKHRAAVLGFGLLRSHAGGLPCRSMELPHNLPGRRPDSVCNGDVTTAIPLWPVHPDGPATVMGVTVAVATIDGGAIGSIIGLDIQKRANPSR